MVYPASFARYEDLSYIFNNNIDYLEENGFEIFSLDKDLEQSCYLWGKDLYKFGQSVIDTKVSRRFSFGSMPLMKGEELGDLLITTAQGLEMRPLMQKETRNISFKLRDKKENQRQEENLPICQPLKRKPYSKRLLKEVLGRFIFKRLLQQPQK